jgi:hypothetical protein
LPDAFEELFGKAVEISSNLGSPDCVIDCQMRRIR